MLGTLAHAEPGEAVPHAELPELERLVLHRLAELDRTVRAGYAGFDTTRILSALGLLNTTLALILTDTTIVLPFATWLIKGGIDAIPMELEEAAAIDGAKLWRTLLTVTLPLARPIIGTALLLAVLIVWDEFLYALLFTSNDQAQTLTVAIANLATGRITDYGLLAAAGILAAAPPVLIGLSLQRTLVAGLTGGAVKG